MKLHAMAVAVVGFVVAVSSAAQAATVSRETMMRRLLDACVYRQYEVKDIDRMSMIAKCQCASDNAIKGMEGDSFDVPRSGGLTGPQDQGLKAAMAACFAPKAK